MPMTRTAAPFRIGDHVRHGPTGETWIVAAVDGADLWPAGWPESCARVADCELAEACDDERHAFFVGVVRRSDGRRGSLARAHTCSVCTCEMADG
jgi:hypothetical protein